MDRSNNRGNLSSLWCIERPITVDEACALRIMLFGKTSESFKEGWSEQGFKFRTKPPYGLLQKRAGPCGLLAAVQAYILYELLYGYSRTVLDSGLLKPGDSEKKEALSRALASILWHAGDQKEAVLAQKSNCLKLDDNVANILARDGLLEYVTLKYFKSRDHLLEYLYNFIPLLMKEGGCILVVYSLLLTHGIDKMKEEMDLPYSHLIGNDEFCSQELINLILTGKAVSNIFDGEVELNSGGEETSLLRGISRQSKIGLLSFYEYQNTVTVGNNFKDPEYPIWIINGRQHFSVLFGTTRNVLKSREDFRLFYYDTFARCYAETSLVISPIARMEEAEKDNSLSVVVCCILTRWPLAEITHPDVDETESES